MTHYRLKKWDGALSEVYEVSFMFHHGYKSSLIFAIFIDEIYHFTRSVAQAAVDVHKKENFWVSLVAEFLHVFNFGAFRKIKGLKE